MRHSLSLGFAAIPVAATIHAVYGLLHVAGSTNVNKWLSIYLTMQKFSKFLRLRKLCNDHMRHFGSVIFYVLAIYGHTLLFHT